MCSYSEIEAVEKALNEAVTLATKRNIPPLKGRTLILVSISSHMKSVKLAAKTGQKSSKVTNALNVAWLCSLMCQFSCESSELVAFDTDKFLTFPKTPKNLLQLVQDLSELSSSAWKDVTTFPSFVLREKLMDFLRFSVRFDRFILVHGGLENVGNLQQFLAQYRCLVNSDCLYADIDVCGTSKEEIPNVNNCLMNNVYISGFSDAIFKALECGNLTKIVENVDKKHNLLNSQSLVHAQNLRLEAPIGKISERRKLKVFFSSTFVDMHSERNLINYYLFPELARRAQSLGLEVIPIDLRWGIYEGIEAEKQVEACLDQVDKCDIFVGILGHRYGWQPPVQNSEKIKNMLGKRGCSHLPLGQVSITQMEIEYALAQ